MNEESTGVGQPAHLPSDGALVGRLPSLALPGSKSGMGKQHLGDNRFCPGWNFVHYTDSGRNPDRADDVVLWSGAGPAAALLVTLPAISLPSLFIVRNAFPAKVLLFVSIAVVVLGVLSGLLAGLIF